MPNAYTEDQLVEQPAIGLFAEVREANTNLFHLTKLMSALVSLKESAKPKGEK